MENYKEEGERGGIQKSMTAKKTIVFALIPLVILSGMIVFIYNYSGILYFNSNAPLPDIAIEKVEFHEGLVVAHIRNTGPEKVTIAQADINDRIHPAGIEPEKTLSRLGTAKVSIPFSWNQAEPYEIGITTDDGTRFSRTIDAAAQTPVTSIEQASIFALIGTYVGILPVMIGLLWYPFIHRLNNNMYNFILSLTAGLLVFLGVEALIESSEIASENISGSFNGQVLTVMVTVISFIALLYISEALSKRAKDTKGSKNLQAGTSGKYNSLSASQLARPLAISLMVAIGIGLHNFGEGLAIGAAILLGEVALSTFLIVGFTLHNTTEGLAIAAPLAKTRHSVIKRLFAMGLIAGVPTIIGTWIGGFLYSPFASIIFLAIGAGAIFQVVYSITSWMASRVENKKELVNIYVIAGFVAGMLIMYATALLI